MPKIYLYAEILTQIRTLNLYASLETEKREGTKVDVSTDKKVITVTHDGESQQLYLPTQIKGDASVTFPLQKATEISARVQIEDEHEWKVLVSNEIEAPWLAPDLSNTTEIQCRYCNALILPQGKVTQWKELPSENWAELMDMWFCHKPHDEQESEEAAESKGFSSKSRIAIIPGTGMTDLTSLVLHTEDCKNVKAAESRKAPNLIVLRCANCAEMLGTTNHDEDLARLHKSSLAVKETESARFLAYPAPIFTCAQILSLIEATALKKFVVHTVQPPGEGELRARPLLLWVFNPDIYYSCSAFDGNGVLTNAIPVDATDPNPNHDDTSQIYSPQRDDSSNNDPIVTNDASRQTERLNPHGDDTSQLYGETQGPQMVAGDIQFEVPVREKASRGSTLSEIPIEPIEEQETSLETSKQPANGATTSVSRPTSTDAPKDHINLVHRATKIFYKRLPEDTTASAFLDTNNTTHEELYLPNPADLITLREALEKSTSMLPSSARVFQDWSVGLLDRYEKEPSGLGVMQENPLARGIKSKDGRVTRWDIGHGAEGLYA